MVVYFFVPYCGGSYETIMHVFFQLAGTNLETDETTCINNSSSIFLSGPVPANVALPARLCHETASQYFKGLDSVNFPDRCQQTCTVIPR